MEISGFFVDSVLSCYVFLEAVLWERNMMFFWKLSFERAFDALLEQTLEKVRDV